MAFLKKFFVKKIFKFSFLFFSDEQNLPKQVKLIDFQMAHYESLVYDLIFFMFSSLEIQVLEYHTDELLLFYYNAFVKCLEKVGVSTQDYSFVR